MSSLSSRTATKGRARGARWHALKCWLASLVTAFCAVLCLAMMSAVLPASAVQVRIKNTFYAQCWLQPKGSSFRVWWDESGNGALAGAAEVPVASDGKCSTVPESVYAVLAELETDLSLLREAGLPMPQSDRAARRINPSVWDNGSPAHDVMLDGRETPTLGETACWDVSDGRPKSYRTYARLFLHNIPAGALEGYRPYLRMASVHELVHFGQCAVKDAKKQRSGWDIGGYWREAIPNAIAATAVGGRWDSYSCFHDEVARKRPYLLSTEGDGGYQMWGFWAHLLGPRIIPAYLDLLSDVTRSQKGTDGQRLEAAVRKRYTDAQLRDAILAWMADGHFVGSMPSASGVPATWDLEYLSHNDSGEGIRYVSADLQPAVGSSASAPVTIPALGCTKILANWPVGSTTLTVSADGPAGTGMVAGANIPPGAPPDSRCGNYIRDQYGRIIGYGPRVMFPVTDGHVTAAKPCVERDTYSNEQMTPMWILLANGSSKPVTFTVTATAS